jgi:hypothetical protein
MDTTSPTGPAAPIALGTKVVGFAAAVAVAAGGVLHLCLWNSDYREIPDGAVPGLWVVKVGFPLNAVVSIVVAIAVAGVALGIIRGFRRPILAVALAVQAGSVAALVLSRGPGIFGWTETGYSTDAKGILAAEVLAIVLLVATEVLASRTEADET